MIKEKPGFIACERGFKLTFANGWQVSVQWNHGNMCSNETHPVAPVQTVTAELMVINPNGNNAVYNAVYGWQTPEQVVREIAKIAKRKP